MFRPPLPPVPVERQEIDLDADVLFGAIPSLDVDASLDAVTDELQRHGIRGGLICSLRGALFDACSGNDEMRKASEQEHGLVPVGTVDIRDALTAETEIGRLAAAGVRLLRLFPVEQWVEPDSPGLQHVVDVAVEHGLVLLTSGDVSRFWRPFSGARVCFLDVHAYRVADFVVLARREPGFVASTRMLVGPDSIERIAGEVGAHHLAYGSRAPLHDVMPSALRLRMAALNDEEWRQVAGGTASRWLGTAHLEDEK
ncbi:amidohydrolase family protein [Umezawaea sp. NPDC059074]|uniref:amidohydrolase family protein n=1 Tax=Umezawaea sp. NPDC059074 TaxID=3346716 RepID=UPI0036C8CFA5